MSPDSWDESLAIMDMLSIRSRITSSIGSFAEAHTCLCLHSFLFFYESRVLSVAISLSLSASLPVSYHPSLRASAFSILAIQIPPPCE